MTMIEKMARAMCDMHYGSRPKSDTSWRQYIADARAALEAMKESDENMVGGFMAEFNTQHVIMEESSEFMYPAKLIRAAIQAALDEEQR